MGAGSQGRRARIAAWLWFLPVCGKWSGLTRKRGPVERQKVDVQLMKEPIADKPAVRRHDEQVVPRLVISRRPTTEVSRSFLWLCLWITAIGGSVLRLWQVNSLGFNSDEAVYAGQAAAIAGNTVLQPFF